MCTGVGLIRWLVVVILAFACIPQVRVDIMDFPILAKQSHHLFQYFARCQVASIETADITNTVDVISKCWGKDGEKAD